MAIDVCSEISSPGISPRISFSHDLNSQADSAERRLDSSLLDSSSDFDFCIGNNNNSFFQDQLSSADELFSNGRILPTEIKKPASSSRPRRATNTTSTDQTEKKRLKEFLSMNDLDDDDEIYTKSSSKSFWQFKRSSSLNCESTRSKSLIRSLHFLSRSNSTGSAPNPKPATVLSKEPQKQNLKRQQSVSKKSTTTTLPSSGTYCSYNTFSTQKPPLLKKCGSYGSTGVRISPVLNIPPPYISNATVNLFGFGSLFCNGKVKKKKR
ncbi:Membrane-associated kinase regulator [Melia azedarach]|uniref:Membrane-associated kinase regulator n=1 Tax=Melia azedarach TaxID=155640 RepID=A0ACC1XGH8_MELAZ|nr:Membrane-associated kinase regulator [Melia azedarach]